MTTHKGGRLVAALLAAGSLVLGACGGGDDGDDAQAANGDGAAEDATDGSSGADASSSAAEEGATIVVDGMSYALSEAFTCLVVPASPWVVQVSGESPDGSVRVAGGLTSVLGGAQIDLDIGAERYQVLGVAGDLEIEMIEDPDLAEAVASGTMERVDGSVGTVSFELIVNCRG